MDVFHITIQANNLYKRIQLSRKENLGELKVQEDLYQEKFMMKSENHLIYK